MKGHSFFEHIGSDEKEKQSHVVRRRSALSRVGPLSQILQEFYKLEHAFFSSTCFLITERGKELVTGKAPAEANHLGAQKRCFLQAFAFPHRAGACRASGRRP